MILIEYDKIPGEPLLASRARGPRPYPDMINPNPGKHGMMHGRIAIRPYIETKTAPSIILKPEQACLFPT